MPVHKCKGTRDLSPVEMTRFRRVESTFRDICLKWGYDEVRTPTLEYLYLFTAAGTLTPGRLGKVYSFLDWDGWSGERVVMRPDGTIPIARYYIETMADKDTARFFYVTNVFTFEETGLEAREKWQCGAELIGPSSPAADAEMVVIALDTLKELGVKDVQLRLSHAGLIRTLLAKLGLTPAEQHKLFDRVLDGDTQALTGATPGLAQALAPVLGLKGSTSGFLRNLTATLSRDVPEVEAPLANFTDYAHALDSLGISYEIDIASGRGFEYYTGAIFHVLASGEPVAGGGRYDALVPLLGGPDTPACGFALYLDKIIDMTADNRIVGDAPPKVMVRFEPGGECLGKAFRLIEELHNEGLVAEIQSGDVVSAGAGWLLDVTGTSPDFVVKDLASGHVSRASGVEEVLSMIRPRRAR